MNKCMYFYFQRRGIVQNANNKNNFGTAADKKILFVMCYFVSFCSVYFASNDVSTEFNERFTTLVNRYFSCEANGYDPERTCDLDKMAYEALSYTGGILHATLYILLGAFPAVTLVFIVHFKKSKSKISKSSARGREQSKIV